MGQTKELPLQALPPINPSTHPHVIDFSEGDTCLPATEAIEDEESLRGYWILIVPESHPVVLHLIPPNANDDPGYKSRRMNWRWRKIIWLLALGSQERKKVENNSQL